jgi:hypothetical protein
MRKPRRQRYALTVERKDAHRRAQGKHQTSTEAVGAREAQSYATDSRRERSQTPIDGQNGREAAKQRRTSSHYDS